MTSLDSFKSFKKLNVGTKSYRYFSLKAAEKNGLPDVSRLPYSLKVLLENLLRHEDGRTVKKEDIENFAKWLVEKGKTEREIAFRPARVLMQDFTGVPAVVDLAAMRDAMVALGGDPQKINPLVPVDLVIDHSVIVDQFGTPRAFKQNVDLEYERNGERYRFLKWGQSSFDNFRVVPPGTGICHQVNLEYLGQTIWTKKEKVKANGKTETFEIAFPDTLVGTDSHTTMVNGLSVLGWGVGGIEAEAAMLGQPLSMLAPEVVGFRLTGRPREGVTATDVVLTVTQMLRKKGVVGKFVEFYGEGLDHLALADRATIANMAPEYGATCGFFPIDAETHRISARLRALSATHRACRKIRHRAGSVAEKEFAGSRIHRFDLAGSCRQSFPRSPARSAPRAAFHWNRWDRRSGLRSPRNIRRPATLIGVSRLRERITISAMATSSSPPSHPALIRRTRQC